MNLGIFTIRQSALLSALAVATVACSSSNGGGSAAGTGGSGPDGGGGAATGGKGGGDGGSAGEAGFDAAGGPTDPIPTKALEWVWVPFPDAKCRDGSTAGIEVNANPASDNLMIFLEGGGSCWNKYECGSNPANFVPPPSFVLNNGVFDRANSANPVKDWSMVYVPYCTGDLHAGKNPGFDPGYGIGPQQFVGYTNIEKFLGRIVPTFPNVKKVLHAGFSAGGYGALYTVELVGKTFPSSVDVVLIADSAPLVSTSFLPACIQRRKRTIWGFDKTFLKECGADCRDPDNYYLEYAKHLSKTYPNRRSGIMEAEADATILAKWGYTANDCSVDITQAPAPMDAVTFKAGLLDFRTQMAGLIPDGGTPNFGTFYLPSSQHGWLSSGDSLYTGSAGGENLIDWFTGIVNGTAPMNVGP